MAENAVLRIVEVRWVHGVVAGGSKLEKGLRFEALFMYCGEGTWKLKEELVGSDNLAAGTGNW